jgi:hypothetical protein
MLRHRLASYLSARALGVSVLRSNWIFVGSGVFAYNFAVRSRNLAIALAAVLVSCGGSGDPLAPESGNLAARLRVTVRPDGPGGAERVRHVECAILGEEAIDPRCRALGGVDPDGLAPVPRRTACARVYGGPGTARVTGELRGVRISAEFDLTDACEIDRWRRNAALLGAPGVGHAAP